MTLAGSEHPGPNSVFVTGATGFIGKRLVPALLQTGARVTVLLRSRHGASALEKMGAQTLIGSLGDRAFLETVLREQDVLFHLAYDMRATANDNLTQFNLLRTAAETAEVGRIVHISSIVIYDGWPQQDLTEASSGARSGGGAYRQAKRVMEQTLMDATCPVAILQPTLVYGPGSVFWTDQLAAWLAAGTVVLPDPEGLCNAVFVDDLVQAMLRAARLEDLRHERFIISGAAPIAWSDMMNGYADIIGRGNIRYVPQAELAARLPPATPEDSADTQSLAARISAAARVWMGRERFETLVHGVKQRLPHPDEIYPDRYMLNLLSARGHCQIDHARTRLGYTPEYDLKAGLAATRKYLQARFS